MYMNKIKRNKNMHFGFYICITVSQCHFANINCKTKTNLVYVLMI